MFHSKQKTKRKILFVGMVDSVHVARWISQIGDQDWEIYLFPVEWYVPNREFRKVSIFGTKFFRPIYLDRSVRYIRWSSLSFYLDRFSSRLTRKSITVFHEQALLYAIQWIKPDIVHSLEFQHAGYLTLTANKKLGAKFPVWIATSWGSDIYLFGRLSEHQEVIREMMANCDYYSCECVRDIQLGRDMGYHGPLLPVLPSRGGFKIDNMMSFRQPGPVSKRKTIIVKGYQSWAGRALVAFRALRRSLDLLQSYSIVMYAVVEDVKIAARLFEQETGIPVRIIPPQSPEEEILRGFGSARIYIGLGISDGISTSLLEAMVMGAFPIQSCTACADEWIQDGKSGFIVPPEEPEEIGLAIRRALLDDALVDRAAELNERTARERLDYSVVQSQAIKIYEDILRSKDDLIAARPIRFINKHWILHAIVLQMRPIVRRVLPGPVYRFMQTHLRRFVEGSSEEEKE